MRIPSYVNWRLGVGTAPASNVKALPAIKILANANRFAIMELLFTTKKDLCVHEISSAVGLSQSATSHQLAYLEARGVVESVRTGKTKCYLPARSVLAEKLRSIIRTVRT